MSFTDRLARRQTSIDGRSDLEDLAGAAWEPPREEVLRLRAEVRRLQWALNRHAASLASDAKARAVEMTDKTNRAIDANPVATLLSMFAVGMVVGLFLRGLAERQAHIARGAVRLARR